MPAKSVLPLSNRAISARRAPKRAVFAFSSRPDKQPKKNWSEPIEGEEDPGRHGVETRGGSWRKKSVASLLGSTRGRPPPPHQLQARGRPGPGTSGTFYKFQGIYFIGVADFRLARSQGCRTRGTQPGPDSGIFSLTQKKFRRPKIILKKNETSSVDSSVDDFAGYVPGAGPVSYTRNGFGVVILFSPFLSCIFLFYFLFFPGTFFLEMFF